MNRNVNAPSAATRSMSVVGAVVMTFCLAALVDHLATGDSTATQVASQPIVMAAQR